MGHAVMRCRLPPSSSTDSPKSRVWHFTLAVPCPCLILDGKTFQSRTGECRIKHFRLELHHSSSAVDGLQGALFGALRTLLRTRESLIRRRLSHWRKGRYTYIPSDMPARQHDTCNPFGATSALGLYPGDLLSNVIPVLRRSEQPEPPSQRPGKWRPPQP